MVQLRDIPVHVLLPYLSIGDLYRLRATASHDDWDVVTTRALSARIGLARSADATRISAHMWKRRCRECGTFCSAVPRFCTSCTSDPRSRVALMTRAEIRILCKDRRQCYRAVVGELARVRRSRVGAFLYWRDDVFARLCTTRGAA